MPYENDTCGSLENSTEIMWCLRCAVSAILNCHPIGLHIGLHPNLHSKRHHSDPTPKSPPDMFRFGLACDVIGSMALMWCTLNQLQC
ncbi:hypothetical protein GOP47_0022971 [Adiantum capillus-veneris]|uniref:Uncharacterized protein n=1 Tax=Adiantum capillus-veneris TaxID=13818 RepID=A0A9D4U6U6_ADICA|nr:hypothetical protein GOP47_0022971 [Adiantum capillus-veneris]